MADAGQFLRRLQPNGGIPDGWSENDNLVRVRLQGLDDLLLRSRTVRDHREDLKRNPDFTTTILTTTTTKPAVSRTTTQ